MASSCNNQLLRNVIFRNLVAIRNRPQVTWGLEPQVLQDSYMGLHTNVWTIQRCLCLWSLSEITYSKMIFHVITTIRAVAQTTFQCFLSGLLLYFLTGSTNFVLNASLAFLLNHSHCVVNSAQWEWNLRHLDGHSQLATNLSIYDAS